MTAENGSTVDSSAEAALEVIAGIYRCRKEISSIFGSHPAVTGITQDCYAQRSNNVMTEEPEYLFEVYVEATTHDGASFSWHVSLWRRPSGWELDRLISAPEADVKTFEDASFKSSSELAAGYSALLDEFVESARVFDFDHPPRSVADNAPA